MRRLISLILIWFCFCGAASRSFDGISDSIDQTKPSALVVGTDSFTRGAWVYWTDGVEGDEVIFSQQDGTGTGRTHLEIDESGIACGLADRMYNVFGGTNQCGTSVLSGNTWVFVGVKSDEGAGTVANYYDTAFEGSVAKTVEAATGSFRVGVHKSATNLDFEGLIAYNFVCEAALTADQMNEIKYNPEVALAAYCGAGYDTFHPFWGTSPEQDLSGNGLTGTVTGATTSNNGPPVMTGAML